MLTLLKNLKLLKYLAIAEEVATALGQANTVGGESVQIRPSYDGRKYEVNIRRIR
jgi:hypothetical protein